MTIHREGVRIIYRTVIILLLLNAVMVYFFNDLDTPQVIITFCLSLVILALIFQFFRYPNRKLVINDKYIIAPADGKVVVIEETDEPEFLKTKCRQISIFMSPFNVHANWYPTSGRIAYLRYHYGKYLVAWHPKASTDNERTTIVIEKENKSCILVRQIAGALAKRIVYYPHEGDLIRQGSELGFIKFGSRVDVFIPLSSTVKVSLNQKTKGGLTILAEL